MTCCGVISFMHLKCPLGHLCLPMCEQGRHFKLTFCTTMFWVVDGKKPSSSVVLPKIATTGFFKAEAMCISPLSFESINWHFSINAAVSITESSPATFRIFGLFKLSDSISCLSNLSPKRIILNLDRLMKCSMTVWNPSMHHLFVAKLAPGAIPIIFSLFWWKKNWYKLYIFWFASSVK